MKYGLERKVGPATVSSWVKTGEDANDTFYDIMVWINGRYWHEKRPSFSEDHSKKCVNAFLNGLSRKALEEELELKIANVEYQLSTYKSMLDDLRKWEHSGTYSSTKTKRLFEEDSELT